jgi:carboxylesterase type B
MGWYPLVFKPYIDDFSQDPFIPKDPWDIINTGEFNDVPLIIGNNKDEGLNIASEFHEDPSKAEELIKRWDNELGPLYITGRCG